MWITRMWDICNVALSFACGRYNRAPKENPDGKSPLGLVPLPGAGRTERRLEVNAETRKVNAVAKPAAAKKAAAKVSAKTATQVAKVAEAKAEPQSLPSAVVAAGGGGLARSTRPSARLTQLTVPSMAPAAAFDAAKASYINTMPTTMQAPSLIAAKKDPQLANNWKTKSAEELTDAEVLAMPEEEYMNDKQMAFFRHKLV